MKFAYADPPYLGCAQYYKAHHPEAMIWNDPETHRALIERLQDEFPDGWALALHAPSLWTILPMCPKEARVGAWLTKSPRYRGNFNAVSAHFEPLIWVGGRPKDGPARCADFVICSATNVGATRGGNEPMVEGGKHYRDLADEGKFFGRKPNAYCLWIFQLLGAKSGDDFHDLFPGSGAVSAAWAEFCGEQPDLPLTPLEQEAVNAS